jgi:hypothetical protein
MLFAFRLVLFETFSLHQILTMQTYVSIWFLCFFYTTLGHVLCDNFCILTKGSRLFSQKTMFSAVPLGISCKPSPLPLSDLHDPPCQISGLGPHQMRVPVARPDIPLDPLKLGLQMLGGHRNILQIPQQMSAIDHAATIPQTAKIRNASPLLIVYIRSPELSTPMHFPPPLRHQRPILLQ